MECNIAEKRFYACWGYTSLLLSVNPPFRYKYISDNRYPVIVKDYTSGSLRVLFFLLSKYNLKRDYINQYISLTCINRFWYCTMISFSKHPPVYPGSNMLNLSIHKWPDKFIVSSYKINTALFLNFSLKYSFSVLTLPLILSLQLSSFKFFIAKFMKTKAFLQ